MEAAIYHPDAERGELAEVSEEGDHEAAPIALEARLILLGLIAPQYMCVIFLHLLV